MNPRVMLASAFLLTACALDTGPEDAPASGEEGSAEFGDTALESAGENKARRNYGYYRVVRRDTRRCAAPLCGGYFIASVNRAQTLCADGTMNKECYVSAISLHGLGLSTKERAEFRAKLEKGQGLIKAGLRVKAVGYRQIGALEASEGFSGATGSKPEGTFYRVASSGIQCITAPCPSLSARTLNHREAQTLVRVELDKTVRPADAASLDAAAQALATNDGVLIVGSIALPKCAAADTTCGPWATASEFYQRVRPSEPVFCGVRGAQPCAADQYCKWQPADICGAADAPGVCAKKPEVCTAEFLQVCGCDGKTYSNACVAASKGASVSSQGPCKDATTR